MKQNIELSSRHPVRKVATWLREAEEWKRRIDHNETQADIVRETGFSKGEVSGRLKVLDLPERVHEMLLHGEMNIEAAMNVFARLPTDAAFQEAAVELAKGFRQMSDELAKHLLGQTDAEERKPSKIRRSPENKIRAQDANEVREYLVRKGLRVRTW